MTALKVLLIPLKFLGCTDAGLASVTALHFERKKEKTKDMCFRELMLKAEVEKVTLICG